MKDNIEGMDKAIKEKFYGHEVPVPSHLWNSIESNLTPGKGNTDGYFFLKTPFILSILFVSTVFIGTYLYNSKNKKGDDSTTSLSKTNTSENRSNNSSTTYSSSQLYTQSSIKEKNKPAGSLSNQTSTIEAEDKHHAIRSSSNIDAASNKDSSKNKNTVDNFKNRQYTSNTTASKASTISTENKYRSSSANNNSSASNKNTKQHAINNNSSAITNQSGTADLTNTSSDNIFTKGTENNNAHSTSIASNPTSDLSGPINPAAAMTPKTENTSVQASGTHVSKNNDRSAYADSIKLFTSAFLLEPDSFNKIENSDPITFMDKNTSTGNTKTSNRTTISASNQDVHLNAASISSILTSLNSNNVLPQPSETAFLYNQDIYNNKINGSASTNNKIGSNTHTNTLQTSLTNTSIDSTTGRTLLENYFHTNATVENDTILAFAANNSTKELLIKINSTMLEEHADTNSTLKQPETIEVKSSEEEKNKKPLFLSRCSFDGYVTPALGYMYLYTNNTNDSTKFFTKDRNKSAYPGFGITTGLRMNYALTQKIEIGIGLQYSSLSQKSSFPEAYVDSTSVYQGFTQIDSTYDSISQRMIHTSYFVVTDTTQNYFAANRITKYTNKFQNFSIPIHIAYGYSISNKLSLISRASLLINYQTYSVTYLNAADGTVAGYHSNKNLSLGGSFSIGCYYLFSKKCAVFAEPIVSYYFSNLFDKQVPFKQKQLMLGLQTGIRLSF